jgi:hypothetical protein
MIDSTHVKAHRSASGAKIGNRIGRKYPANSSNHIQRAILFRGRDAGLDAHLFMLPVFSRGGGRGVEGASALSLPMPS